MPRSVRNVIDVIDYETAAKLLDGDDDKGEDLLFVNVHDAISDLAARTPLTPDQAQILLLPFKVWGSRAGLELHRIRKKRWAENPDPVQRRRESLKGRFEVKKT